MSKSGQKIALLGLAGDDAIVGGGGSGSVVPSFVSTPLEGVRAAVASGTSEVTHDEGFDERAAAIAREAIQWTYGLAKKAEKNICVALHLHDYRAVA